MADLDALLACLERIEAKLDSDEYEYSDPYTIGGPTGLYQISSPYNTECEWAMISTEALGQFGAGNGVTLGALYTILNLPSAARATYSQQFSANIGLSTELAIDFNITAITGGAAPTVTFKISRVGADGVVYQMEQAAAISAAGVISYSIGTGLDNKSFAGQIQVDMVTTGAPTSVTFSASIQGKGLASNVASAASYVIGSRSSAQATLLGAGNDKFSPFGGKDSNPLQSFVGVLTQQAPFISYTPQFMPLQGNVGVFLQTNTPGSTEILVTLQFRRKLEFLIPSIDYHKPHTHTPLSARNARTFMAGFAEGLYRLGAPVNPEPEQDPDVFRRTDRREFQAVPRPETVNPMRNLDKQVSLHNLKGDKGPMLPPNPRERRPRRLS